MYRYKKKTMKGIAELLIKIQIIGSEKEIQNIVDYPANTVAERCFTTMNRRILAVEVVDVELADDNIEINKMLDSRISGEKPLTKIAE